MCQQGHSSLCRAAGLPAATSSDSQLLGPPAHPSLSGQEASPQHRLRHAHAFILHRSVSLAPSLLPHLLHGRSHRQLVPQIKGTEAAFHHSVTQAPLDTSHSKYPGSRDAAKFPSSDLTDTVESFRHMGKHQELEGKREQSGRRAHVNTSSRTTC